MAAVKYAAEIAHVGIPTENMEATVKFYEDLGFKLVYSVMNGDSRVCFLEYGAVQIEAYEVEKAAGVRGGIDHLALACTDIEACYEEVKRLPYPILEGINFLPFWDRGIRYFLVQGPNSEVIEFCQRL